MRRPVGTSTHRSGNRLPPVGGFAPEFHTRAQLRLDPNSIFLPGHQTVRMCGRHQSGRNSCAARHRHRQVAAAVSYARPGIRRSRRGFLQVAPLSWSPARAICRPMCRNTSISRSSPTPTRSSFGRDKPTCLAPFGMMSRISSSIPFRLNLRRRGLNSNSNFSPKNS